MTKLDKHKVEVQILPDDKDREAGKAIPLNHAIHLGKKGAEREFYEE